MRNSDERCAECEPFQTRIALATSDKAVSHALRSSGQNNGDIGDVLRAAAKPGAAIDL